MSVLHTEVRGHVGIMTLNRPEKHNAMDAEMFVRMAETWTSWSADSNVRCAVVTGAGNKAFSVGGDLGSLIPVLTGARPPQNDYETLLLESHPKVRDTAMLRAYFPKPVVAAINGFCVAGGTEFIQGTDIRVCTENATFGLPEVKRAIVPAGGSLTRLSRQIPFAKAMELILTGNPMSAAEALQYGLVNYVTTQDNLLYKALEIANEISANGPLAVAAAKKAVIQSSGLTYENAYVLEDEAWDEVASTEDAKEGPIAFLEKRPAVYVGR